MLLRAIKVIGCKKTHTKKIYNKKEKTWLIMGFPNNVGFKNRVIEWTIRVLKLLSRTLCSKIKNPAQI